MALVYQARGMSASDAEAHAGDVLANLTSGVTTDHVLQVIQDAREFLLHQLEEDAALYRNAQLVLDGFTRTHPLEGFRYWSVRGLARDRISCVKTSTLSRLRVATRSRIGANQDRRASCRPRRQPLMSQLTRLVVRSQLLGPA